MAARRNQRTQMAIRLLIARHGETARNSKGLMRGWSDDAESQLDEAGKAQVKALAASLASLGVKRILCSDLGRALETAKVIGEATGVPAESLHSFRPLDIGDWGGKPESEVLPKMDELLKTWEKKPEEKVPGGESLNDYQDRLLGGLGEVLSGAADGSTIVIVGHDRTHRLLKAVAQNGKQLFGPSVALLNEFDQKPGDYSELEYDQKSGKLSIVKENILMNSQLSAGLSASPYRERIIAELVNTGWTGNSVDEWAKLFVGKHLEPGVVKYDNPDGTSKIYLLTREAIAKMRPTAEGKPMVGKSGDFDHKSVKPSDYVEGEVDGVAVESFDSADGWDSIRFMLWDQATKEACKKGFQLSCAYVPTETDGKPGKWHNVDYDETILNGEYTHFAVVPNPRYEGAVIQLVNSLKRGGDIVEKMLKTLLNCIPLAQLKSLVNSIEEDEKKKTEELAKKNATTDGDKAAAELAKIEPVSKEAEALALGAKKENAAPPDPAVEGASVISKEKQPDTGTEEAAKKPASKNAEPEPKDPKIAQPEAKAPEADPKKNDGDLPPAKPEPGTPGASGDVKPDPKVQGKLNADVAKDIEKSAKDKEKANVSDAELARAWDQFADDMAEDLGLGDKAAVDLKTGKLKPYNLQPANVQVLWKEGYTDAHGENSLKNALKRMRERRNAKVVEDKREFLRQERFNSLRDAAEERGGFVGTAGNQIVSPDDKQDLGRTRYGS